MGIRQFSRTVYIADPREFGYKVESVDKTWTEHGEGVIVSVRELLVLVRVNRGKWEDEGG